MTPSIRFRASSNNGAIASSMFGPSPDGRSHLFSQACAQEMVRLVEVEDDDRNAVVHAKGRSRGVHYTEPPLQEIDVFQAFKLSGVRVHPGVFVVHAVHA